jgi:hypothetical protein
VTICVIQKGFGFSRTPSSDPSQSSFAALLHQLFILLPVFLESRSRKCIPLEMTGHMARPETSEIDHPDEMIHGGRALCGSSSMTFFYKSAFSFTVLRQVDSFGWWLFGCSSWCCSGERHFQIRQGIVHSHQRLQIAPDTIG